MRALAWMALYIAAWAISLFWIGNPGWPMLLLYPVACPAMYYAATPIAAHMGLWRYLSGGLTLHRASHGKPVALHLGTGYDMVWRLLPRRRAGETTARTLHREIYAGLARFCTEVEAGKLDPAQEVITCSYFLGGARMDQLGFREEPTPLGIRLNFLAAYPEVLFQQWLVSRRLRFFSPGQVRFFRARAGDVAARAALIRRLAGERQGR